MANRMNKILTYDTITDRLKNPKNSHESEEDFQTRQKFSGVFNDAKIFRIDEMTLDSLINEPGSFEDFSKFEFKLPFPLTFFDFDVNLDYRFLEDRNKDMGVRIGGVIVSDTRDGFMGKGTRERGISVCGHMGDSGRPVVKTLFIEERAFYITEYPINIKTGKKGEFLGSNYYIINPLERKLVKINWPEVAALSREDIPKAIESERDFEIIDDDYLDAFKLANLVVNTIDYVNAQNVTIRKNRRTRTDKVRVGTGKARHLEKLEVELKPYYWIEVDKRETRVTDQEPTGDKWTLNYRVWVRGHFQRYHTNQGIRKNWVQSYVKGPEDAPWKNNRYEVLYKKFRYLLEGNQGESCKDKGKK